MLSVSRAALSPSQIQLIAVASPSSALVKQLGDEATWARSSEFFQKEYVMNSFLANMKKPVVSLMHGFTRESRFDPSSRLSS